MLEGGARWWREETVTGDPKVNFFNSHVRRLAEAIVTFFYVNAWKCSFSTLLDKYCL